MAELLERTELLAGMDQALEASARLGQVVLVAGEAGIGKTALVRRFVDGHAGARVLTGLCDPLLTPRALGPLHDIARSTGGRLAELLGSGARREAVFDALLDELGAGQPPRRPQVVVVEDAHWADAATLDLLVFLGRRWEGVPAVLVVTYREDELGTGHPLQLALGTLPTALLRTLRPAPLSSAAVADLARRAGRPPAGVHALTGGNPLLVTESLAGGGDGVPSPVRDLVAGRLAALSPAAREVARLAAVVPTATELWLLESALGPRTAELEECADRGLLVVGDQTTTYRHELLRRAVADSLSPLRRKELNRRVLQVLTAAAGDRQVDPARVVHHAREAQDAAAVTRFAPAAAEAAAAVGAHREAAGHYEAALAHTDALPPQARAELLEGFAFHAYVLGRIDDALAARRAAVQERRALSQPERVGEDQRWISRLWWWAGSGEQALLAADEAIAVLEGLPPGRQLGMAYSARSQLDMLARRFGAAVGWGRRALEVAAAVGDQETVTHALINIGTARLTEGEPGGGDDLQEAFALAVREGLPDHAVRALVNLACIHVDEHRFAEGLQVLERAIAFADDRELEAYADYLLAVRGRVRLDVGDWPGAESDARAALSRLHQRGVSVVPALVTMSRLLTRRGEAGAEALALLDDADSRARGTGEVQRVGPVAAARLEAAELAGAPLPLSDVVSAFELAVEQHEPWYAGELAWRLGRAGVAVEAPDWVAQPYLLLVRGDRVGAAAAWERLGCPYDAAEALAGGDDAQALQALAVFDSLGAAAAARLVRRRLAASGAVPVPRGPRPSTAANPAGLTDRQLDVLRLVADGRSNAEIAARLTLSVRTVDHHVSAVLLKLGVTSRREARDLAEQWVSEQS
ncbi:AAA ATPase-like protein [Motilibacter peucedani]|uniref:AAA ATPase-like protein n=1 Tax=Motilibacter peucedani TaxID=598650 RepID=A0A420XLW9_9ACTN|nr:AAA family ATPase [Motilibacter peucedani]RKS71517.1 AAA ATPase-like protein [Motilibacter peucedani]